MFGLMKPRSPLSTARQVDIELLMRRNVEVVGASWVGQSDVVTDIAPWNLDRLHGFDRVEAAAAQVSARMPPGISACRLAIQPSEDLGYPSTYTPSCDGSAAVITLSDETAADPLRTVIELAFQYASDFWHRAGDGRVLDRDPRTTHLLPICCGLGVLASDACLYDLNWQQAGWAGWSVSRSGYYNAQEIGFALALFCRTRRESRPDWVSTLRLDSKVAFEKSQRYFEAQQRDGFRLLYDAETVPGTGSDRRELVNGLAGEDSRWAYASALALVQLDDLPTSVAEAAMAAIERGDHDVVPLATRVLGRLRLPDKDVERCLARLIERGRPVVRLAALQSAHELGLAMDTFQSTIGRLLDQSQVDPLPLLEIIQQQGHRCASLAPNICQLMSRSLHDEDETWAGQLVECLSSLVDDPRAEVTRTIRSSTTRKKVLDKFLP